MIVGEKRLGGDEAVSCRWEDGVVEGHGGGIWLVADGVVPAVAGEGIGRGRVYGEL